MRLSRLTPGRLTPGRWVPLVLVAGLLAAGVLLTQRGAQTPPDALTRLRAAAALAPCPDGLGQGFPASTVGCLDGGPPVDLRLTPTGTPQLVNIWATWCPPCVAEVPELVAFQARAGTAVRVVGVLTTDAPRDALLFAAQYGMRYANLDDQDGLVKRRFVSALPGTLFVDRTGRVVHIQRGPFTSVEEIAALTARYLGVTV